MTGRYAHTDGHRSLCGRLSANEPDLFGLLADAGYRVRVFGKNHCWDDARWSAFQIDALAAGRSVPRPHGATLDLRLPEGFQYAGSQDHCAGDEEIEHQATAFLGTQGDDSPPFAAQVNFESPHPRYGVSEPWFSMFDRQAIAPFPTALPEPTPECVLAQRLARTGGEVAPAHCREIQAVYYGMIAQMDARVGRLLAALEASGQLDRTVVLFWSDHGDYAGQYGLVEKWDTHFPDCLVHVPCLIRAPQWPAGRVVDALSDHTDLVPTLSRLLGFRPSWSCHGHDLAPTLGGKEVREAVYSEGGHESAVIQQAPEIIGRWVNPAREGGERFPKNQTYIDRPSSMARSRMVRTRTHKLVVRSTGDNELYDLRDDPWELRNRVGDSDMLRVKAELLESMARWALDTDPDRPQMVSIGA